MTETRSKYELKFNDGDIIECGNLQRFFRFLFEANPVVRAGCPSHYTAELYARNRISSWFRRNYYECKKQKAAKGTFYLFDFNVIPGNNTYTVQIQRVMGFKKDHRLAYVSRKQKVRA